MISEALYIFYFLVSIWSNIIYPIFIENEPIFGWVSPLQIKSKTSHANSGQNKDSVGNYI
jgi:hypothetical protein